MAFISNFKLFTNVCIKTVITNSKLSGKGENTVLGYHRSVNDIGRMRKFVWITYVKLR